MTYITGGKDLLTLTIIYIYIYNFFYMRISNVSYPMFFNE